MHEKHTKKCEKRWKMRKTTDCANEKEYACICEMCAKKKTKYIEIVH